MWPLCMDANQSLDANYIIMTSFGIFERLRIEFHSKGTKNSVEWRAVITLRAKFGPLGDRF